ncbi:MAG: DNA mismatch repair endonuclease MutL [Sphaerochaetaceae bacterium]
MDIPKRIQVLDPLVAQRIAAGEVIDRPSSVVRELLDNAIDAGSTEITIQIVEGGLERITVIDNGVGIAREDLPLCCRSHATSKVSTLEDLYALHTLGFRGEALYSIAASAKVTIASKHEETLASTVVVDNGMEGEIVAGGPDRGTRVDVEHLFASIPARRLFLKRPSTEFTMCKNMVVEKAIAFPEISFRLHDENRLRLDLPATTAKQRLLDALSQDKHLVPSEVTELSDEASRFSLRAIATTPACYRTDRSHIKIYVNRRPIEEYALVQAVSYGYQEMLPGGAFPYCYLFVDVDPELVDFNIHPAKREAKLRNKAEIHHQVVVMIRQQISKSIPRLSLATSVPFQPDFPDATQVAEPAPHHRKAGTHGHTDSTLQSTYERPSDDSWFHRAREILAKKDHPSTKEPVQEQEEFAYIGQVFDLFLIVRKGESLYMIDQHAAHERILYDRLRSEKSIQRLIVPLSFDVERSVDEFLQDRAPWYAAYGLDLRRVADLSWELDTIPASWKSVEREVVTFISSQSAGDMDELEKRLYATIACHAAIKDGDAVDRTTAQELIRKVFALEHPVCPHGRTFVVEITKDQLFRAVGRIM